MTDEIKSETISEIKKSDSSLEGIVAEILKNQEVRIDKFEKRFDDLATLIKEHNANPVDTGVETESKPKVEDANDVGDKVTIENKLAPKPSDSQASIIASENESSGSDKSGLKMENKAEEDEKKEEVKVEAKDDTKDEDVKKSISSEYEFVKSVRPVSNVQTKSYPTAYQVLKSITNGWNGKTSSAEQSLSIAYEKLHAGEFGNGFPTGGY
jgi:hypothetical protein